MATLTLTDVELFLDEYRISCAMSQAELGIDVDVQDATTFCHDTRTGKAGLITQTLSMRGFWDGAEINAGTNDSIDELFYSSVAREDALVTVCPEGSAVGDIAFAGLWEFATYVPGAEVGALLPFDVSAGARSKLTRVTSMIDGTTQRTGTVTAGKQQLGAVAAGNRLVAVLHVYEFDGTSLDVVVRSDANATAGGETSRGTFAQLTGVGSGRLVVAAPITDAYWDATLTFVGTSFTAALFLGIEATP